MTASIRCPRCARTSHHPDDVREGYCSACHDWTSVCAHCGGRMGDHAGGYGSTYVDGRQVSLCHPNAPGRPDCYHLVTVYHRPLGELAADRLLILARLMRRVDEEDQC